MGEQRYRRCPICQARYMWALLAPTLPCGHPRPKQKRGFAGMPKAKQLQLASKGGTMAHLKGTAHTFTSAEAKRAGAKGGKISRGGRGRLP